MTPAQTFAHIVQGKTMYTASVEILVAFVNTVVLIEFTLRLVAYGKASATPTARPTRPRAPARPQTRSPPHPPDCRATRIRSACHLSSFSTRHRIVGVLGLVGEPDGLRGDRAVSPGLPDIPERHGQPLQRLALRRGGRSTRLVAAAWALLLHGIAAGHAHAEPRAMRRTMRAAICVATTECGAGM